MSSSISQSSTPEICVYRIEDHDTPAWRGGFLDWLAKRFDLSGEIVQSPRLRAVLHQAYRLGTRSIVAHPNYICRDFFGDFSAFYSKQARPPKQRCLRLLFFRNPLDDEKVLWMHDIGLNVESSDTLDMLEPGLVGLTTIRPTAGNCMGRTIMDFVPADGYLTCRQAYKCHLYGATLYVSGAPWQEQDRSIYVCGGTAIWAAAYHLQNTKGMAHYSPGELTAVARRHFVTGHVAAGMTMQQIASAISEWGFQPYRVGCRVTNGSNPSLRKLVNSVHASLESNLPVIVAYWWGSKGNERGHAVTAFGHGLSSTVRHQAKGVTLQEIRPTAHWVDRLIVADDGHAPYWSLSVEDKKVHQPLHPESIEQVEAAASQQQGLGGTEPGVAQEQPFHRPLSQCKHVLAFTPLPLEVRVMPSDVSRLARLGLRWPQVIKKAIIENPQSDPTGHKMAFLHLCDRVHQDLGGHAIRPRLMELWRFHRDLKQLRANGFIKDKMAKRFLRINWPTWIWVVQIIRLHRENDQVDWNRSVVIGEVLVDATWTPDAPTSIFAVRLGAYCFCPTPQLKLYHLEDTNEYPLS